MMEGNVGVVDDVDEVVTGPPVGCCDLLLLPFTVTLGVVEVVVVAGVVIAAGGGTIAPLVIMVEAVAGPFPFTGVTIGEGTTAAIKRDTSFPPPPPAAAAAAALAAAA